MGPPFPTHSWYTQVTSSYKVGKSCFPGLRCLRSGQRVSLASFAVSRHEREKETMQIRVGSVECVCMCPGGDPVRSGVCDGAPLLGCPDQRLCRFADGLHGPRDFVPAGAFRGRRRSGSLAPLETPGKSTRVPDNVGVLTPASPSSHLIQFAWYLVSEASVKGGAPPRPEKESALP